MIKTIYLLLKYLIIMGHTHMKMSTLKKYNGEFKQEISTVASYQRKMAELSWPLVGHMAKIWLATHNMMTWAIIESHCSGIWAKSSVSWPSVSDYVSKVLGVFLEKLSFCMACVLKAGEIIKPQLSTTAGSPWQVENVGSSIFITMK